jgi:hypothetical protein
MKKIYNVVCQSAIGDGVNIFNETYTYDWGSIPNVPYYVSFVFVSCSIAMVSTVTTASLYVDLSQVNNQLATSSTASSNNTGMFLGNLRFLGTGATNVLYADTITNPPTYINGRPNNNLFTVHIHGNPSTDFTSSGPYSLVLSFLEA